MKEEKSQNKGILIISTFQNEAPTIESIFHRYGCQIHKRSNILMTIKLSTTNSVNKTLQHKALWDLETPYWDVVGGGDSRGSSGLQRW